MSEPRGSIALIQRAPLDISYQHQIDFKSPSEQLAFWGSLVKYSLSDYTYIRRERRSIKVNKSFDELEGINYLTYQAHTGSGTKRYYCFVTDKAYVNDETTTIFFEIDVFQTYMFDYSFKPTYISQAHVDRWNADHTPKYSITEEGLDYGSEYVTESAFKMKGADIDYGFYLIAMDQKKASATDYGHDTTIEGNPVPYVLHLIPRIKDEKICGVKINESIIPISSFHEFQECMRKGEVGVEVRQITYLPYLPLKHYMREATSAEKGEIGVDCVLECGFALYQSWFGLSVNVTTILISHVDKTCYASDFAEMNVFTGLEEKLPSDTMWNDIKTNPRTIERDRRFESKLLCHPYRYNIFTDWTSSPILIKNEYLSGDKIKVKGNMGFGFNSPRRFWIEGYRGDPEGREASISQSLPLEQPIITDAYYQYMLQNRNQISANVTNAKVSAITGVATGAVQGLASGGIGGMIGGALFPGIDSAVNIQNMIRSENAKQADIKNMPDTISNANDCTLALADDSSYLTIYRKKIACEYEEQIAQYWHMYGYKVNKLEVPNLRSRVRYNYIKTIGANIEGAIESNYLAQLKAIFDNGVTIWHYSSADFHPLDYTFENPEVILI